MKGVLFEIHQQQNNEQLLAYLCGLSLLTKKKFGPHPFTLEAINNLANNKGYRLYTARYKNKLIGYSIIKIGWLDHEKSRLMKYGITENYHDITLAPSIADEYQGKGIGCQFLQYILNDIDSLMNKGNIYLWGGVQKSNKRAIKLYEKIGFVTLGVFNNKGAYLDMVLPRKTTIVHQTILNSEEIYS
ncbi:GNAT family N-acetyltransferase [Carboxylicivirga caseinilyticus]|uniref:GNAT family N-acetyltransferase n=1 Tax=Carboxylicivirga caseinilyticus TaxID=3417572 RepID=UPI003D33FE76|nr:GNAT family N-acetyltransferase [Marinilabiliaceae bacterium A049]